MIDKSWVKKTERAFTDYLAAGGVLPAMVIVGFETEVKKIRGMEVIVSRYAPPGLVYIMTRAAYDDVYREVDSVDR